MEDIGCSNVWNLDSPKRSETMAWAVKFEVVSKRYRRGGASYGSLRDDLAQFGRKAAALLHGGTVEPRGTLALDRVSLEVGEGEAFAIIGPNGAGKTTILKLLTRISYPTEGRVRVRGRVGALIEVGSGIHPELTGRENIWLYGRIMGMSRRDISRRFDEIVGFSELAHALDTQVKAYSTGMQLRLGFAIASHLDPDVFVVDEALAVGDAGFQAKCVDRMMRLIRDGKTLLFVSHNLPAVEGLCRNALFLHNGHIVTIGAARDVLRMYLDWNDRQMFDRGHNQPFASNDAAPVEVAGVSCHGADGQERYEFTSDDPLEIRIRLRARQTLHNPHINLGITDGRPGLLIHCSTLLLGQAPERVTGEWTATCKIEKLNLMPGLYRVWCDVYSEHGHGVLCDWREVAVFRIVEPLGKSRLNGKLAVTFEALYGAVRSDYQWTHTLP